MGQKDEGNEGQAVTVGAAGMFLSLPSSPCPSACLANAACYVSSFCISLATLSEDRHGMSCSTVTQVSVHTPVELSHKCWWGSTKNHLWSKLPLQSTEETLISQKTGFFFKCKCSLL